MKIEILIVGDLKTNCYLISSDNEAILIDPGAEAEKILNKINKQKYSLKYIINTHYHWDHILADEKIRQETGAGILIHELEKEFINIQIERFLKDHERIKIGKTFLEIIHTPGHTKGSICIRSDDKKFLFTGDTLFKDGVGRTDLPGGCEKDLIRSLQKIQKLFDKGMIIYPGHGEVFKI